MKTARLYMLCPNDPHYPSHCRDKAWVMETNMNGCYSFLHIGCEKMGHKMLKTRAKQGFDCGVVVETLAG